MPWRGRSESSLAGKELIFFINYREGGKKRGLNKMEHFLLLCIPRHSFGLACCLVLLRLEEILQWPRNTLALVYITVCHVQEGSSIHLPFESVRALIQLKPFCLSG